MPQLASRSGIRTENSRPKNAAPIAKLDPWRKDRREMPGFEGNVISLLKTHLPDIVSLVLRLRRGRNTPSARVSGHPRTPWDFRLCLLLTDFRSAPLCGGGGADTDRNRRRSAVLFLADFDSGWLEVWGDSAPSRTGAGRLCCFWPTSTPVGWRFGVILRRVEQAPVGCVVFGRLRLRLVGGLG